MCSGLLQGAHRHVGHATSREVQFSRGDDAAEGIEAASGTSRWWDRNEEDSGLSRVERAHGRDDGIGEEDTESRRQRGQAVLLVAEDEPGSGAAVREREVQGSRTKGIELAEMCRLDTRTASHRCQTGAAQGASGSRAQEAGPTQDEVGQVGAPRTEFHPATMALPRSRECRDRGSGEG